MAVLRNVLTIRGSLQAPLNRPIRMLGLPQEIQNKIFEAYFGTYSVRLHYEICDNLKPVDWRKVHREHCDEEKHDECDPLCIHRVDGIPATTNLELTCRRIYVNMKAVRRDAFDGNLRVKADMMYGLNAFHELKKAKYERLVSMRERVKTLVFEVRRSDLPLGWATHSNQIFTPVTNAYALSNSKHRIDIAEDLPKVKEIRLEDTEKFIVRFSPVFDEEGKLPTEQEIQAFHEGKQDEQLSKRCRTEELISLKEGLVQRGMNCDVYMNVSQRWLSLNRTDSGWEGDRYLKLTIKFREHEGKIELVQRSQINEPMREKCWRG